MQKVRLDKWLWSVRIFKTRSKASEACKSGKVATDAKKLKPSYHVSVGDVLNVKKGGFNLTFKVNALISKRVSATLAAPCYDNLTPVEELNKYQDWYIGKANSEIRERGTGRPTKRERRSIETFKEIYFEEE
ncbi:MAG: RNA-binding S4 domain-containing protein [Saprospiraceae bacterium]|nr:RNA-binding S4 domain-containing protein [Saprospiraceae bacterium]